MDGKVEIVDVEFVSGEKGTQSLVVQQTAPSLWTKDGMQQAELDLAHHVAEILVTVYSGYDWFVEADLFQGIVKFKIPDLMGASLAGVINLGQYPDVPRSIVKKLAGEMLERMGLPRGHATREQIIEAKKRLHTFQFGDIGKMRA